MDNRAPIFTDAFALCQWLLERLDGETGALATAICNNGLKLLEAITLALRGRRREACLEDADECLLTLRVQLRLADTIDLLSEKQVLFALEYADRIGRQLGGWQRSLPVV